MKKRIIIEGEKVHNIGYRPFLLAKARRLGIPNYDAENVAEDGKQKIIVSLEGDEKSVIEFVKFAKGNYPIEAMVSQIIEGGSPEHVMPVDEYVHLLGVEQQNTVVQSGLKLLNKQDQMLGKQDQMLGKQDQMIDKLDTFHRDTVQKFDRMDEKYDKVSNKLDKIDKTLERLTDAILAVVKAKS